MAERKTVVLEGEVLESYWRQCEADGIGLTAVRTVDLLGLIAEVRHLRSERSGYRQGLEDAAGEAEEHGDAPGAPQAIATAIRERIARLDVDAEQESEHVP